MVGIPSGKRRVWVLQHTPEEHLGTLAAALEQADLLPDVVATYEGARIPRTMEDAAGIVVMGGPMGVYDLGKYPFLREELGLLGDAVRQNRAVLGICLGSQLLAAALGAVVAKGPAKEIGWHPVRLSSSASDDALWRGVEPTFRAFHWHGDQFVLPRGAELLASSDITPCQAFRFGRAAYGMLFHMEVTMPIIEGMTTAFADELREVGSDGPKLIAECAASIGGLRAIGDKVFQRWTGLALASYLD